MKPGLIKSDMGAHMWEGREELLLNLFAVPLPKEEQIC